MTGQFAKTTEVPVERTRAEIEAVLAKYGADAFAYAVDGLRAQLGFRIGGRYYRFALTLPPKDAKRFTALNRAPYTRSPAVAEQLWAQECRSIWRALLLVIKAKLEAVAVGISTLEDEFMAATVLGDGSTMGETMKPQIEEHYRIGGPPRLMLEGPRP